MIMNINDSDQPIKIIFSLYFFVVFLIIVFWLIIISNDGPHYLTIRPAVCQLSSQVSYIIEVAQISPAKKQPLSINHYTELSGIMPRVQHAIHTGTLNSSTNYGYNHAIQIPTAQYQNDILFNIFFADNMGTVTLLRNNPSYMVLFNFTFCVDSFFVLGGFLVTYLFLKQLSKTKGKRHWWDYCTIFLNRYFR